MYDFPSSASLSANIIVKMKFGSLADGMRGLLFLSSTEIKENRREKKFNVKFVFEATLEGLILIIEYDRNRIDRFQ